MELLDQLGALHRAASRLLRKTVATRTPRPFQQLRALRAIDLCEPPCTQAMVADLMQIDAPAISRLVGRLVEDGLVLRRAGDDRRSVRLAVTRAAARDLAIMADSLAAVERQLVTQLGTPAARRLSAQLAQLTSALGAEPRARRR